MKRWLASLALAVGLMLPAYATASAYNPLTPACSGVKGPAAQSTTCAPGGNSDPITGPNGIIRKATNILAILAGVAAVIVIIIAGIQYITSNGDPQKAANARTAVIGAVIGLVIIIAAQSIIVFVVSKL